MNTLKLLLFSLLFISCISTDKKDTLTMERKWIKPTIRSHYLGPKLPHLMSPVFLDDLVIQGNSHGTLMAVHSNSGRIAWKFNAQHGIHGAVVLEDNILFGTSGGLVVLLDKKGNKLWNLKLEGGIYSKPTVRDNFIYFLTSDNVVYAINLDSKKISWTYNRNSVVAMSVLGNASPIPYGDILLVGFNDGYLVALNQKSGVLVWEQRLNISDKFRDIDGMALDGDTLYVANFDSDLLSLNAKDGNLIWKSENSAGGSHPTIAGDVVITSSSRGKVEALKKTTGEKLWEFEQISGFATGSVVLNDIVYFGQNNGPVVGLDIKTGKKILSYAISGALATPRVFNSNLYIISNSGNLVSIKLNHN